MRKLLIAGICFLGLSAMAEAHRYIHQYQATIDTSVVDFGTPATQPQRFQLLVGIDYPNLPLAGRLSSQVTTLHHDVDISGDDEYACLSRAEFAPLSATYLLFDSAKKALWSDRQSNFPVYHSTQGPASDREPESCPIQVHTGRDVSLTQAQVHGRTLRIPLADGSELVMTPFYDGLWFDGSLAGNGRTEALLVRLSPRGAANRQLHWGLHQAGSASGRFSAGGIVTLEAR